MPLAAQASSFAASLAIFLIALAVALAFLYFGLKWVGKNEDQTRAALAKVGINPDPIIPNPAQTISPPPGVDPITAAPPAAPAPIQPIVLSAPPSTGQARLLGDAGRNFPLSDGANLVSRESGAILLSGESTVSRRHAEVVLTNGVAIVRDLGSTNGTFVNGGRITGEQSLRSGDSVQFGAVTLRYEA